MIEALVLAAVHATHQLTPYHSVLHYWWAWALILAALLVAAVLLLTWDAPGRHRR